MSIQRLVRFVSSDDGKTYYGAANESLKNAKILESGSPFSASARLSDKEHTIEKLLCPIDLNGARSVVCIGLNYTDHAEEAQMPIPKVPVVFFKPVTALAGPHDDLVLPRTSWEKGRLDYETELVIVIGKKASRVSKDDALDYVFGYTAGNDISNRAWQLEPQLGGGQWCYSKCFDCSAPIGPAIVSKDILGSAVGLGIRDTLNDTQLQDVNTNNMIFGVAEIVSFLSQGMTLLPDEFSHCNFKAEAGTNLAILNFDINNPVQISLVANDGKLKSNMTATDTKGFYSFVKTLKNGNTDRVLLASFGKGDSDTTKMALDVVDTTGDAPTITKNQATISASLQSSKIIIVGDLRKTGKDEIVALFDSQDNLTISVNEYAANGITETTQKRVPQTLSGFPLIRPFFSALVPSEDRASPNSLSILQVSLHEYNKKPHFIFRLTDTVSWTTKTSSPVEDRLASDPHYFHLKWIRCSRQSDFDLNTSNVVLEIFSFYGVLGIRLFAPTSEKKLENYQEIGMLQYMGQTSIGTRLGCEGD
ncbi:Fumarylacetoacetate hydrolase domain-containing protein 2 [Fusarium culmorum]|uniref:Fumarylacetoacetate hydrolase domain-containing protein 2 n=1 Tax=Fusarium culmorum TaxID=5516 RepID=A0A2T4GYL1_FUSCU|nr:Fumarylacetoacetate hydrolase domain-containing protein 2 [Fusarium culmorum]